MTTTHAYRGSAIAIALVLFGCGSDDTFGESGTTPSGSGAATGSGAASGSGGAGATSGSGGASDGGAGPTGPGAGGMTSGSGGGAGQVEDPAEPGPYQTAVVDEMVNVAATGNTIAMHAVYPTSGPDAGPYPVVIMGHGFQLPPSQYDAYLEHLASFGYVALTPDFVASFIGPNNVEAAEEMIAGIDWAAGHATLGPMADATNVGASGHSLGGKVALLAATMDNRIKASITLDPVDSSPQGCSAQNCPDVSALMPVPIPTGFLGETIDASGGFMSCAPAADNFTTFYANTSSPSLMVDVLGANHMSFLDDPSSCGLTCSFCNAAQVDDEVVFDLASAYVVAFYERHLKNRTGYDAYLTGTEAQTRYVDTGLVTIQSK
jgi:chlorophyllase